MDSQQIINYLKVFLEKNRVRYGIRRIGIFGSFARGQASEDSDIDIVVETDKPDLFLIGAMQAELSELLHRRIDLVRLRERMNDHLKKRIVREAIYV
jgi:predicted nucleotidyltransferase